MLSKQKNKSQLKPNKRRIKLLFIPFILLRSILWITFISILVSCNTTEPPKIEGTISLTVEDVSSTEAWLNVKTQNVTLPAELKLFRADSVTQIINLGDTDTLLYDNELQPNKTYNFKVTIQPSNHTAIQSKTVTATTMDTTSHNFSWQTYTFGGANGSSVLNDVAIINENNIWAVGEIHTAETDQFDSNGVWVNPYNLVHWDGQQWELKRIGSGYGNPYHTVYAFNENDVWFDGTIQWDGIRYTAHINNFPLEPNGDGWRVNAMWGTSSSDFYVVGNNGNIAHYNGSGWTKIESGTDLDINDIWGSYNKKTGKWEILCVASNVFSSLDRVILSIDPLTNRVTQLSTQPIGGTLRSIWFETQSIYYAAGGGIYQKHCLSESLWKNGSHDITTYSTNKIRANDIIAVGGVGEVLHFNGKSWKSYFPETHLQYGNYYSAKIYNNIVVAIGDDNPTAVLIIGKRHAAT